MSNDENTYEALDEAARRIATAYDPSDPANLIGMMMPFEGELREIVDAQIVDGQPTVRLAASENVTITIATTEMAACKVPSEEV